MLFTNLVAGNLLARMARCWFISAHRGILLGKGDTVRERGILLEKGGYC